MNCTIAHWKKFQKVRTKSHCFALWEFDIVRLQEIQTETFATRGSLYLLSKEFKMPRKPKRPCFCPGCGRLTDGRYCDEHRQTAERQYNRYLRDPDTNKRYGRAWKKLRARFLLQHPLCEQCRKEDRLTAAEEVHHLLPLANGGTNDERNLMALCKSCHSSITIGTENKKSR
jgi:5-methylcytosine-specific restriction protein A